VERLSRGNPSEWTSCLRLNPDGFALSAAEGIFPAAAGGVSAENAEFRFTGTAGS
jgi:hypothetical protein